MGLSKRITFKDQLARGMQKYGKQMRGSVVNLMSEPCLFPVGHDDVRKKSSEKQQRVRWTSHPAGII